MPEVLRVSSLSVNVPGRTLASELSFSLCSGQVLQVSGANGAGKTTLLRTLLGLIQHDRGSIQYGSPWRINETVGYLPQNSTQTLLPWLNPIENILLGLVNRDMARVPSRFAELLTQLFAEPGAANLKAPNDSWDGLASRLPQRPIETLSGG